MSHISIYWKKIGYKIPQDGDWYLVYEQGGDRILKAKKNMKTLKMIVEPVSLKQFI